MNPQRHTYSLVHPQLKSNLAALKTQTNIQLIHVVTLFSAFCLHIEKLVYWSVHTVAQVYHGVSSVVMQLNSPEIEFDTPFVYHCYFSNVNSRFQ